MSTVDVYYIRLASTTYIRKSTACHLCAARRDCQGIDAWQPLSNALGGQHPHSMATRIEHVNEAIDTCRHCFGLQIVTRDCHKETIRRILEGTEVKIIIRMSLANESPVEHIDEVDLSIKRQCQDFISG